MINVALFASSNYITPILEKLVLSEKVCLKLFITKPQAFTEYEFKRSVEIFRPEALDATNTKTITNLFSQHEIKLGVVADYGLMIPEKIISAPQYGLINIHFSKLPKLRGASPVQYTILNGLSNAAISIIEMTADDTPKVDSGKILFQQEYPLTGTETTQSLYTELFQKASMGIEEAILNYTDKTIVPIAQKHEERTFTTPSGMFDRTTLLMKDDAYISSANDPLYIERAVRAFTPWPRTWITLGELLKIGKQFDPTVKTVIAGKNENIRVQLLKAHLENNVLFIDEAQADGKKATTWKEFKNGYFE